jgi:hypothetical protein
MKISGKLFRTIFSSPIVLVKQIRKINTNNFVGGLIFGAIFSLIVNVVTVQIQETIAKQKTLEAIEREIYSHLLLSEKMETEINNQRDSLEDGNALIPYVYTDRFSTSVWDSGDASGYIYDLDPTLQDDLYRYYTTFIDNQNRHMEHAEESVNQMEYEDMYCLYSSDTNAASFADEQQCEETWIILQASLEHFEEVRLMIADVVNEESSKLLKNFHPTQDRLDSWILKSFMGNEVSESLSIGS